MGRHILTTQRLSIDEADEKDATFFFKLMNSEHWIKFIGDRGISNEDDARLYIMNSLISSYQINGFGLYKVSLQEGLKPIGICGFVLREYLDHPDIGFAILPEYEGKGYISEAAIALISFGIKTLGLTEILGITTKENIGSRKILKRMGLSEIKIIDPYNEGDKLLLYSNKVE